MATINLVFENGLSASASVVYDTVAPIANPTFTGTAAIPNITMSGSINAVSAAELSTLDGITTSSSIQTQLDTKAPLAAPTFTGNVVLPSTTSIGTISDSEILTLDGVSSNIQTQLGTKAPVASPTFTGTVTIPAGASISGFAPIASPTFTGTVTIPAGASISGFAPTTAPTFTTSIDGSATFSAFASTATLAVGGTTAASITTIQGGIKASGVTKEINIGTGGASGSTTNINLGSATSGSLGSVRINENIVSAGLFATGAAAPTVASATTIAPTTPIVFISGTTAIVNITAPSPISLGGGQITLIPLAAFTTTVAGNIGLASTAVVRRALIMTYDATTAKWYPSY
jgi:hypothetical protein